MRRMPALRILAAAFVGAFKHSESRWKREHGGTCTPEEAVRAVYQYSYTPQFT